MPSKSSISTHWEIPAIIVACILTRLPQLLSPHLMLDGDECILGLMAKHMYEGKEFPIFFYGQAYGFSLIESGLSALFFFIGGISDYSMKAAMLLLWTAGVVFLYKSLCAIAVTDNKLPLFFTIIFILCPAWAAWSMKARGGYLTAFTCSFIVTWLLFRKQTVRGPLLSLVIGSLLVVIYESQPLWLAGLLPFVAYKLCSRVEIRNVLLTLVGGAVTFAVFLYLKHGVPDYWHPSVFTLDAAVVRANFLQLPAMLFSHMHGHFYLMQVFPPSMYSAIVATIILACCICMFLWGAYLLAVRQIRSNALFLTSLLAVFLTIAYVLFITRYKLFFTQYSPRYLLPLTGWLLIAAFILVRQLRLTRLALVPGLALIIVGILSAISFKDFASHNNDKAGLIALSDNLLQQNVHHVFVTDALLQWQLMFYSREQIAARFMPLRDRFPAYVLSVNDALAREQPTALLGPEPFSGLHSAPIVASVNGYSVLLNPDRNTLEELGFRF